MKMANAVEILVEVVRENERLKIKVEELEKRIETLEKKANKA